MPDFPDCRVNVESLTQVPTLYGTRVRLEPLGLQHLENIWGGLHDPETLRLTGTRTEFTRESVANHLSSIGRSPDRADWAIIDTETADYIGEIVLNDLEDASSSMNLRIALLPGRPGHGYGTEAIMVVLEHAFSELGLHRVYLDVYSFNPRAQRVYEKVGFIPEGRQRHTLNWNGEWVDSILMSILDTDPRPALGRLG